MIEPFTLVAFHAHPDDESLLTGGTLARCAAEGHRVVLVVATLGDAGGPAAQRRSELRAAAAVLGCARVAELGYRDSGLHGEAARDAGVPRFIDVPVEEAAARLADILREERADVLIGYDSRGGYGHPDHLHVHRVGRQAADEAGTRVLLEATVDRARLRLAMALVRLAGRLLPRLPLAGVADAYTPSDQITHVVDVRRYARRKRTALRAHVSQARVGRSIGTAGLLGLLPLTMFRLAAGREWYVRPGSGPGEPPDIFARPPR